MSNRAWVTLATNDSYGLGALVLAHSLRRAGSAYPAVVLITPSVTDAMRERLRAVFAEVISVDVLDSRDATHLALLQRPELGITFTKIHCWNLTNYEKCVFLDADALIVQNCDELFERVELSAAPDVGWPDCFNSGVFVFTPSADTYSRLIKFAQERGSFDGGDQGLLNAFFSDWAHGDINRHLPFLYNVTSAAFYSYLPALKHYGQNMKIIHFIGNAKPWLQHFNWESRSVDAPEHLREFLQLWWDLFVSQVHSQLDTTMSGVAGNLARVVPGEAGYQREAIDELTRRQGWEAGNIDYMGADSFDNIWAKISQTLNQPRQSSPPKQPSPPRKEPSPPKAAQEATLSATVETPAPASESPVVPSGTSAPPSESPAVTAETLAPSSESPAVPVGTSAPPSESPAIPSETPAPPSESPVVSSETLTPSSESPAVTAEIPAPSSETPAVPTETPAPPLESSAVPAETLSPPSESPAVPAETPAPISEPLAVPAEPPAAPSESPAVPAETPAPVPSEVPAPSPSPVVVDTPQVVAPVEPPKTESPVSSVPEIPKQVAEAPVPAEAAVPETPKQEAVVKTEAAVSSTPPVVTKSTPEALPVTQTPSEVPTSEVQSAPTPVEAPQPVKPEAAVVPPPEVPAEAPAVSADSKPSQTSTTPEKPLDVTATGSSDSPPLANTPSKETAPVLPAAKSEERRKPAGKLQLSPPAAADVLSTPDSELEDAATLAHAIIASELTPAAAPSPSPAPPSPPVSLAQIGVKSKGKPTTAAQIESSVAERSEPAAPATPTTPTTPSTPSEPATPTDAPKKKIVKKVVKKEGGGGGTSGDPSSPVPPPRKKEKKPKEK